MPRRLPWMQLISWQSSVCIAFQSVNSILKGRKYVHLSSNLNLIDQRLHLIWTSLFTFMEIQIWNPNKFSINIEKIHNFLSISNCHFSYDSSKFICYFTIGSLTSNKTKWIELTQMQRNTEKRIALLVNSTNCRIENVPPPCKISRIFVVNHTLINGLWHH